MFSVAVGVGVAVGVRVDVTVGVLVTVGVETGDPANTFVITESPRSAWSAIVKALTREPEMLNGFAVSLPQSSS